MSRRAVPGITISDSTKKSIYQKDAATPIRVQMKDHEVTPTIYKIIKTGDTKSNNLYVELAQFMAANRYCTRVIGTGSFGTIEDRSAVLLAKPEILNGIKVTLNHLVVKELPLKQAQSQPEDPMMVYPFYYSVRKMGKTTIVDTDNTNATGFANELVASMLCTELFRKVSPHFVYLADFSYCSKLFEYYFENCGFDYTLKDGSTRTLSSLESHFHMWQNDDVPVTNEMMSGILLSVFHSLHVMWVNFNMTHFDLHIGNVYIKVLDDDKYFMGRKMSSVKYFCYHYGKQEFWVKNLGYIIKIGDLGLSQFALGNTRFTNVHARSIREPERFVPYMTKYGGEYPDFLLLLSYIVTRFMGPMEILDKIRRQVYPINSIVGFEPVNMYDGYFNFDSTKIPRLDDMVLNMGLFDDLKKRPKVAEEHVCHVYDTVIIDDLQ